MPDPNHPHSSTTAAPPGFPVKPVAAVAAALLPVAAWGLMSRLHGNAAGHPFIFMLLPVLLASWWGGSYAGIAASLLAVLGAWDLATPRTPLLDLGTGGQPVDLLGALSLATAGAVVTLMHETLRRRTRRTLDAERQAHAQQQSLEARDDIFNETNDLIQSVAADGQILYANRSWCETLGYTREELPALNIFQIIHDGCRDHCVTAFGRLMQGENIGIIQVCLVAKDGHVTELEGNVSARMENGVMVSSRGIFRDISARKQAEAERQAIARRLEEQSAALAALTRNPVLRGSDLPLAFRAITGAAAQTLGVSRVSVWFYDHERGVLRCDDLLEMPAGTHSQGLALPLKDYPAYFAALADGRILAAHDAPADPRTQEFAEGYLKPLGIASMLDATVRTQRGVAGVLCCEHTGTPRQWTLDEQSFAGSLADLIALSLESAERLQAVAALRRSEEEFRTVVESSPSGIVLADSQGIITLVNSQLERDTGYARAELIGQLVEKLVPARHAAAHPGHRRHYIENPEKRAMGAGRDLAVRRKDGSEFSAEIGLAPIVTAAGKVTLASIVDVTARQQAAAALAESIGKLKRSNTELEQFAYVASHDLQEPLRAISGCVQILEKNYAEKLDANAVELIRHTVEGTARMQSLINDLLAYSRVIQQSSALVPVDFETILSGALVNLEVTIAETGAVVTHDPLPTVLADATQCTQLLQNLIGNAIKFHGQATPQVHVSAERQGALWQFAIRDNGIGIQEQYFDRIFTIFQRLHTREHYLGTGIGLAICQKVVEGCGGRIWLESTPGQGTTFFFTLPHSNQKAHR